MGERRPDRFLDEDGRVVFIDGKIAPRQHMAQPHHIIPEGERGE